MIQREKTRVLDSVYYQQANPRQARLSVILQHPEQVIEPSVLLQPSRSLLHVWANMILVVFVTTCVTAIPGSRELCLFITHRLPRVCSVHAREVFVPTRYPLSGFRGNTRWFSCAEETRAVLAIVEEEDRLR